MPPEGSLGLMGVAGNVATLGAIEVFSVLDSPQAFDFWGLLFACGTSVLMDNFYLKLRHLVVLFIDVDLPIYMLGISLPSNVTTCLNTMWDGCYTAKAWGSSAH